MKAVIAAVLMLSFTNITEAVCRKSQVCDDYGQNCRSIDVCDSNTDLPSTEMAPLTAPSAQIKPLPSLTMPPIGANECQHKQVNGRWQNICW